MKTEEEISKRLAFTRMAKHIGEESKEILDRYEREIDILVWVLCDSSKQSITPNQKG